MADILGAPVDEEGFLVNLTDWTKDIAVEMAKGDDIDLSDEHWEVIDFLREYYDENSMVPAIRNFAKYVGMDKKAMFEMWMTGPMKPITKYGGLPKPTGCV